MKIGLVGTGYWADNCHAAAIAARDDLEFVGIWGRDEAKAEEVARRRGTRAYATSAELFADVDIVSFAVPPFVEAQLAPLAADAGCHLLLEKPISTTIEGAQSIVDAVERNGVRSIVNFTNLIAGSSGEWMRETVIPKVWDGAEVTILADLRASGSPFAESKWRLEDNGALWDVGPHAVSLLVAGLGPIARVRASKGRGSNYVVTLEHERGGVSTVTVGFDLPVGSFTYTAGFWGAEGLTNVPTGETSADASDADSVAPTLDLLVKSIASGDPIVSDAAFGASVTRVLVEAERSAQEKK